MTDTIISGAAMALGIWVLIIQVPTYLKNILLSHLWIVDGATFALFLYMIMVVRSTDVAFATAWAGIIVTILLRIWRATSK